MATTVDLMPFLLLCTPETCDFDVCKYIQTQKLIIALQRLTQSASVVEDMRNLVKKFPGGYEEWEK